MGLYMNPDAQTTPFDKEDLIAAVAVKAMTREAFREHEPGRGGLFGVAVVRNPTFAAAAVAFNKHEALRFSEVGDRPCNFYLLHHDEIAKLAPSVAAALEELFPDMQRSARFVLGENVDYREMVVSDDPRVRVVGRLLVSDVLPTVYKYVDDELYNRDTNPGQVAAALSTLAACIIAALFKRLSMPRHEMVDKIKQLMPAIELAAIENAERPELLPPELEELLRELIESEGDRNRRTTV